MNTQELVVNLQPSKQIIALFGVLLGGNLCILMLLPLLFWLKMALIAVVILYITAIVWRHGLLRHRRTILMVKINPDKCILIDRVGEVAANLMGDSTITRWVCILRFQAADQYFKRTLVIFNDALEPDLYRRLLVAVRTMKLHGISGQNALPSAAL